MQHRVAAVRGATRPIWEGMKPKLVNIQAIALMLVLGLILSAVFAGALSAFGSYGHQMTIHGWIALTIGTFVSLALGVGLMFLVFYSARKGYDSDVGSDPLAPDADQNREPD